MVMKADAFKQRLLTDPTLLFRTNLKTFTSLIQRLLTLPTGVLTEKEQDAYDTLAPVIAFGFPSGHIFNGHPLLYKVQRIESRYRDALSSRYPHLDPMLVHESNKLSVKKVYRVKYAAERISTTIPVSHSIPEEAQIRPDLAPQIHTSFGLPGMSKEIKTFLDDARVQQDHFKNNGINIGIQYKSSVHLGKTALTSFKLLKSL